MSSIGTTLPTASSSQTSSSQTTTSSSKTNPTGGLANESTFLTLLVAQLKNQDPMSPTDGTQFVSQLAQFSSLEQLININTNVGNISQVVAPSASSNSSTSTANTSSANGSTQTASSTSPLS